MRIEVFLFIGKFIEQKKFKQAESVLKKIERISSKYLPYTEMLKKLASAKEKAEKEKLTKLLKEAKALKDAGKLDEAIKILKKGSREFPDSKEIDKLLKEIKKLQNNARQKMKEGLKQWKEGLLNEAVSTLEEAVKIDLSNKKIFKVLEEKQFEIKIMNGVLKKTDKLIDQKKLKEAKSALAEAEIISNKYLPYVEMVKKLQIRTYLSLQ